MYLGRTTLSKFLIQQLTDIPDAGDLGALLVDVAAAVKAIAAMTAKGALGHHLGAEIGKHAQGENPHGLDVLAHEVMIRSCEWGGLLAGMLSAGLEDPYPLPAEYVRGRYLLAFNPLDGSNTDVNVSVGTIFSVLRHDPAALPGAEHYLQSGRQQVAAGYAIYGPATMMVISVGKGTHGFTLDREIGNFILTHPELQIPADTGEFAINTSNARFWEPPVHRYVTECQQERRAWPRFQHALDRLTDRRRAPHAHAWWRFHASEGHARPQQARAAAPAVRGQPGRLPGGAGWRQGEHRGSPAARGAAGVAASAHPADRRLAPRGRAHRALSRGVGKRHRQTLYLTAVQRAFAVSRRGERALAVPARCAGTRLKAQPCPSDIRSLQSPAHRAQGPLQS
jgi:fructose-1,6-bisphosphatase